MYIMGINKLTPHTATTVGVLNCSCLSIQVAFLMHVKKESTGKHRSTLEKAQNCPEHTLAKLLIGSSVNVVVLFVCG